MTVQMQNLRQQVELGKQAEQDRQVLQQEVSELKTHMATKVHQAQESVHTKTQILVDELSKATLKITTLENAKQLEERKVTRLTEELGKIESQQVL